MSKLNPGANITVGVRVRAHFKTLDALHLVTRRVSEGLIFKAFPNSPSLTRRVTKGFEMRSTNITSGWRFLLYTGYPRSQVIRDNSRQLVAVQIIQRRPLMPDNDQRNDEATQKKAMELPISSQSKPPDVPSFSCLVYVSPDAAGGVFARVANLPGLKCSAPSEREALMKIVAEFKKRVADLVQREAPIPWIDPPSTIETGEQQRSIPIHL